MERLSYGYRAATGESQLLDPDHVGCRWLYDHPCTAKASGQLTDSLMHEFDKLFTEYRSPSKFFSLNYFRNVLRIRLLTD